MCCTLNWRPQTFPDLRRKQVDVWEGRKRKFPMQPVRLYAYYMLNQLTGEFPRMGDKLADVHTCNHLIKSRQGEQHVFLWSARMTTLIILHTIICQMRAFISTLNMDILWILLRYKFRNPKEIFKDQNNRGFIFRPQE